MSEHVLETQNIKMYFGGVHAVDDISVYVDKNEILGVIGPNGSGKTTLVNVLPRKARSSSRVRTSPAKSWRI